MIANTTTLGNFEITSMINMQDGFTLHFTIKDPRPEIHKHENSMLVTGSMFITTGEYSTTIYAGESTKFTPRAGLSPFEAGTVSTLTAIGTTTYVCVKASPDKTLNYENISISGPYTQPVDALIVPLGECTINGIASVQNTPVLVNAGDLLEASNIEIGVFTAI